MRKFLLALALFIAATATAQQVKDSTITIDVTKVTKIKVGDKILSVEALQKGHPIILPAELWPLVITIIDKRSYGDLPASQILQLLQIIGQQLPQQQSTPSK